MDARPADAGVREAQCLHLDGEHFLQSLGTGREDLEPFAGARSGVALAALPPALARTVGIFHVVGIGAVAMVGDWRRVRRRLVSLVGARRRK